MEFRRTNQPRRLYLLQRSLFGDYTVGWNGVRTNSMGHLLPAGGVGSYELPGLSLATAGLEGGIPDGYSAGVLLLGEG